MKHSMDNYQYMSVDELAQIYNVRVDHLQDYINQNQAGWVHIQWAPNGNGGFTCNRYTDDPLIMRDGLVEVNSWHEWIMDKETDLMIMQDRKRFKECFGFDNVDANKNGTL